jgi:flagellar basal body P-ring protein FlgI
MKRLFFLLLVLASAAMVCTSCTKPEKKDAQTDQNINLDITVGELARFMPAASVPVRGYGVVAGLWGTGSSECPPALRGQLEKYIWQRMPDAKSSEINRFITSPDTAVVEVLGMIPPLAITQERFDIEIRPLAGTQTTSLRGGTLYAMDLKELSRMGGYNQYTKTIGSAQGQIFTAVDATTKEPRYYILGGGISLLNTPISMVLNQPNYFAAMAIRDRINERFGANTAAAPSREEIKVVIPPQYRNNKLRFLSMIQSLYLSEDPALRKKRIETLSSRLNDPNESAAADIGLEAIGKPTLTQLAQLLGHPSANVRFLAARCMLNIGDNRCLSVLKDMANNFESEFQIAAIESLSKARLKDVEPILSKLLSCENFQVRLAAYEQLLILNSILVKRTPVGGDFFIDQIACTGQQVIYAYKKDNSRIVMFAAPIICRKDIFLDTAEILINAGPEDKYVSLSRRHPKRPKLIGPLKSGFSVEDIICTLGHTPENDPQKYSRPGLGISYSEILDILNKMCQKNMIPASYIEGPLSTPGGFLEESATKTDNNLEEPK